MILAALADLLERLWRFLADRLLPDDGDVWGRDPLDRDPWS